MGETTMPIEMSDFEKAAKRQPASGTLQTLDMLDVHDLECSVPYGSEALNYLTGVLDSHYGFKYHLLSDLQTPELRVVIKASNELSGHQHPSTLLTFLSEISEGPGARWSAFDYSKGKVFHYVVDSEHYYVVNIPTVLWH